MVELRGYASQRYGTVMGWELNRRSGFFPVVRWDSGSKSFANPALLENVGDGEQLSLLVVRDEEYGCEVPF